MPTQGDAKNPTENPMSHKTKSHIKLCHSLILAKPPKRHVLMLSLKITPHKIPTLTENQPSQNNQDPTINITKQIFEPKINLTLQRAPPKGLIVV